VGNKGYRKYLKKKDKESRAYEVDRDKIAEEARFDGKWVLRTSFENLHAAEMVIKYKQPLMVENLFLSEKSLIGIRPVYHKSDETIRGHVFYSHLALVLRRILEDRLEEKGFEMACGDVLQDLDRLEKVEIEQDRKRFVLRTQTQSVCGSIFQARYALKDWT
jgi:transposase